MRKQNIRHASFMVLEKLPTDKLNERVVTPEGVPRLFDLIKPKDPCFASVFYKGVGNTLVANNLDQASRIAFGGSKRWHIVTLAGQLTNSSGTMSDGGNYVSRGGMSSNSRWRQSPQFSVSSHPTSSCPCAVTLLRPSIPFHLPSPHSFTLPLSHFHPSSHLAMQTPEPQSDQDSESESPILPRVHPDPSQPMPTSSSTRAKHRIAALEEELETMRQERVSYSIY
ncbi:SMCs flexible hinge [Suillus occidentalis]|nr:SMCs flexible hinge [Suillus occidentalis]